MKKPKRKPRATNRIDKFIGDRIRQRRNEMAMSQDALGQKLGVSFQQIQKYEQGKNRVSAARLFEICEVLELSLASMFEREPNA